MSIEGEREEWLKNLLQNGDLFFSSPYSFNDVNEFRYKIKQPENLGETNNFYRKMNPNAKPGEHEAWYQELVLDDHLNIELHHNSLRNFSVCCFSGQCQSAAMWGHYTGNNKGVCVVFKQEFYETYEGYISGPVEYVNDIPEVGLNEDNKRQLEKIFLMKQKIWEYEGEVRIVEEGQAGIRKINREYIDGIIVGVRFEPKKIKFYKDMCEDLGINFRKANLCHDSYDLVIPD